MKRLESITPLCLWALVSSACGGGENSPQEEPPIIDAGVHDAEPLPTFDECEASNQSFVRNAHLVVLGARPQSHDEVQVYADMLAAFEAGGATRSQAQARLVQLMADDPRYIDRFSEVIMDALQIPRIEVQSQQSCYDEGLRDDDEGQLAEYVRGSDPSAGGDGQGAFTMRDLLRSALVLDDLSPVYRAQLFAMVSRPIPAANVSALDAELARRSDFGNVFDATYLNRNLDCLGCHNSTHSITYSELDEQNRHWDLPGRFEEALYGESVGIDADRAHAPFRVDEFLRSFGDGDEPWGWDRSCGTFQLSAVGPDIAEIDGRFANLSGQTLTVVDLENALRQGFDGVSQNGLLLGGDEEVSDPNAAFAYLVAASIVDRVWEEVMGSKLTIANHFPRNRESRDLLLELTESFVASRFSLRGLLAGIASTPYFNRLEPAAGCGAAYNIPPVFDPWAIEDEVTERQLNSSGDAVVALSPRTLLRAGYAALEWRAPFFEAFPEAPSSINQCAQATDSCEELSSLCENQNLCCYAEDFFCDYEPGPNEPSSTDERRFLQGIGVFLKHGDRGFRGLDFQARLVFEDRFALCENHRPEDDFIDALLARAAGDEAATLEDLVVATKDRIVSIPAIESDAERAALETLFDASLDSPVSQLPAGEEKLRSLCGALLSSPQFLLQGLAPGDSTQSPRLTPPESSYDARCLALSTRSSLAGYLLICSNGSLTLTSDSQ